MKNELDNLRKLLIEGMQRSKQSSYSRRFPAPDAVLIITAARDELFAYVQVHSDEEAAWRLLAQAEECLLHYGKARQYLEKAMKLSMMRTKKDLRKIAQYRQLQKEWKDILLTPLQLRELGLYLRHKVATPMFGETFEWTTRWLSEQGFTQQDAANILAAMERRGAFNDFQVCENLARG